ncbi:MAG: EAL domain-containing protein [Alphaproteobacteria bacterium]|nr:EAL domain-containing protein [Alphaproteobacteria bacterium]
MSETTTKKKFKQGDILMREGDKGDCAYVIESGNVEILVHREGQPLQIGVRGPGSLLGEMAMIDDKPRTATVRAIEDCVALEISRDDFARRVESADPVVKMVMRVITNRYRDMIGRTQFIRFPPSTAAEDAEHDDELHNIALSTIKVHHELKGALEKKELTLFYQPIIDVQNMKIAGFEALMRWQHPEKGMISPGVFIPVAEESGMIVELSRFALDVAAENAPKLQAAANPELVGKKPIFVGVNFSVKDFADADLFEYIDGKLKEKGVKPEQIHLEITESLLMEAPETAKEALEKCRARGLDVSIDDFGTGYSSLSYLHYFPIDTLKVDQSFIRAMTTHHASMVLVKSIITLARNLNMKVIAEGIETQHEAEIVRNLGCEFCQGYWFAKPMPLDAALDFMKNWQPPRMEAPRRAGSGK